MKTFSSDHPTHRPSIMKSRFFLTFLACSVVLDALPSRAAQHALIVTIENFPGIQGASNLPGCHLDGDNIVTLLKGSLGFPDAAITRLRDQQASTPAILAALQTLSLHAGPDDAVFLYFSTHGTPVPDYDGDEGDGYDECLLTPDFRPDLRETWLVDDRIAAALAAFRSTRITLMVDACHSGTIERDPGKDFVNKFYLSPGFPKVTARSLDDVRGGFKSLAPAAVLTACGPTEPAIMTEIEGHKQSLFTFAFTKALPDNLNAPLADVADAISELIANAAKGDDGKPKQTPQFTGTRTQSLAALTETRSTPPPPAPAPPTTPQTPPAPTHSTATTAPTPPPQPTAPPSQPTHPVPNTAGGNSAPAKPDATAPVNPPPTAFPVTLSTDRKTYDHESLLSATISSPRAGHLRLYYIDATQEVTLIFPNRFHQDDQIAADTPLALPGTLPFKFRVKHPAHGTGAGRVSEILLAVICEEPFTDEAALAAKEGETFQALGKTPVSRLLDKGVKVTARDKVARATLTYQINP